MSKVNVIFDSYPSGILNETNRTCSRWVVLGVQVLRLSHTNDPDGSDTGEALWALLCSTLSLCLTMSAIKDEYDVLVTASIPISALMRSTWTSLAPHFPR